jgi:hypothetical protein
MGEGLREIPASEMFESQEEKVQRLAEEISSGWKEVVGPKGETLSQVSAELKTLQSLREEDDPGKRIENSRRERELKIVMMDPRVEEKVRVLQGKKTELENVRATVEAEAVGGELSAELNDLAKLGEEINRAHQEAKETDVAA